jgi:hypothetical protein
LREGRARQGRGCGRERGKVQELSAWKIHDYTSLVCLWPKIA